MADLPRNGSRVAFNHAADTGAGDEEMGNVFVGGKHTARGGGDYVSESPDHTSPTYRNGIEYHE